MRDQRDVVSKMSRVENYLIWYVEMRSGQVIRGPPRQGGRAARRPEGGGP